MSGRGRRAVPIIAAAVIAIVVTGLLYLRSEMRPVAVTTTPTPVPRLRGEYSPTFDFVDPEHGWALVGGYGVNPHFWIFATTDGAAHWKLQFTGVAIGGWTYIRFFDMRHGFAFAGALYRTFDGGATWQYLQLPAEGPYFTFASTTRGWMLGPHLYTTDDAGTTWTAVDHPLPPDAAANAAGMSTELAFRADGEGWLGAELAQPIVYLTRDGGSTWARIALPSYATSLLSITTTVRLLPGHGVLAIVESVASTVEGFVSDDLGATWRQVFPLPQQEWLADASFLDATHWWAARYGFLYKTSDAGESWTRVPSGPLPQGWNIGPVHVIDGDHGWWSMVATSDSRDNALMMTSDGGASWRAVNMPRLA